MPRSRVTPEPGATVRVALVTSRVNALGEWLQLCQRIVTLGTLGAMLAGLVMLFVYLAQIGRRDLFLQVVATPSGLVTIALLAVALSLSLLFMFFASPWFIDLAATIYRRPKSIPRHMLPLLIVGCVAWCVLVGVCVRYPWLGKYTLVVIAVYLAGLIAVAAYIQCQAWRRFPQLRRAALLTGAAVGGLFALAMFFSLYALWAFLEINPAFGKQKVALLPTLYLVGTMVPELLLGTVLFWKVVQRKSLADTRMKVAYTVLTLAMAGLMVTFRLMDLQVLRALGVYATEPVGFVVADAGIKPGLEAAGVTVNAREDGAEVFHAVVKFRFGGQLVLCATDEVPPIAHAPVGVSSPDASPKAGVVPPASHGSQAASKNPTLKERCLDVQKTDVRRLSKDLPVKTSPAGKAKAKPAALAFSA
jgi:hypothetical protein